MAYQWVRISGIDFFEKSVIVPTLEVIFDLSKLEVCSMGKRTRLIILGFVAVLVSGMLLYVSWPRQSPAGDTMLRLNNYSISFGGPDWIAAGRSAQDNPAEYWVATDNSTVHLYENKSGWPGYNSSMDILSLPGANPVVRKTTVGGYPGSAGTVMGQNNAIEYVASCLIGPTVRCRVFSDNRAAFNATTRNMRIIIS